MTIEAIKFQHIEYFNEFIYKLQRDAYKINQDKITLKGITKINGTNVSVVFDNDEVRLQGRNLLLKKENDSYGFIEFMTKEKINWLKLQLKKYINEYNTVIIYGEYAGDKIGEKIATSYFKMFFAPFCIRIINSKEKIDKIIIPENLKLWNEEYRIFGNFKPDFEIEVNIKENLNWLKEKVLEYTSIYKNTCLFCKKLGLSDKIDLNIKCGEGIVWHYELNNEICFFKSKIEKFQSKAQKANLEKNLKLLQELDFIKDNLITESRMKQGLEYLKELSLRETMSNIKIFINWVIEDCLREDKIFIENNNLSLKNVKKVVGNSASEWYQKHIGAII